MGVGGSAISNGRIGRGYLLLLLLLAVAVGVLVSFIIWKDKFADDLSDSAGKLVVLLVVAVLALVFMSKPFWGLVAFLFTLSLIPVAGVKFASIPLYFTDCVLGASVLGILVSRASSGTRLVYCPIKRPVLWFVGLGIFSNLLCVYISGNIEEVFYMAVRTGVTALGFLLVLDQVRSFKQFKRMMCALALAGALSLALAMWLVFSGDPVISWLTGVLSQHEDPKELQTMYSMVHPYLVNLRIRLPGWCVTTYGGFLAMAIPAAGAAVVLTLSRSRKRLAAVVVGAMFVGLLLNYSRHAWVALTVTGMYLSLFYFRRLRLYFLLVTVALAVVLVLPFATRFRTRVETLRTPTKITSFRGRVETYHRLWGMWKQNRFYAVLGKGDAMRQLYRHGKLGGRDLAAELYTRANNSLLILLADRGILGFLAFLWAFGEAWALARRIMRGEVKIVNPRAADAAILLWGSLVAGMACWFSDNYMTTILPMNAFYWVLLGLFAVAYRLATEETGQAQEPATRPVEW